MSFSVRLSSDLYRLQQLMFNPGPLTRQIAREVWMLCLFYEVWTRNVPRLCTSLQ